MKNTSVQPASDFAKALTETMKIQPGILCILTNQNLDCNCEKRKTDKEGNHKQPLKKSGLECD